MITSTLTTLVSAAFVVLATSMLGVVPAVEQPEEMSKQTAREEIGAMYEKWGQARISQDEKSIESMLAPAFYVILDDEKISREDFITMVLRKNPNFKITRFDAEVLTVQIAEEGWTVVITEKLEVEVTDADGNTQKAHSYWVTRDGCRKEGDKWIVTYSEAIGYERWPLGEKPPVKDW